MAVEYTAAGIVLVVEGKSPMQKGLLLLETL